jgi:acyl CoA:acetate/3-ketoacid CoA transferase alpha subunit
MNIAETPDLPALTGPGSEIDKKRSSVSEAVADIPDGATVTIRGFGHPLGMSGARLAITAMDQLQRDGGKLALCTMCIGVGQGITLVLERL